MSHTELYLIAFQSLKALCWTCAIVLGLWFAFFLLEYLFVPRPPLPVGVVDINRIIHHHAETLAKQESSQKEISKNQEDFIKCLEEALGYLSKEKKVILLKPESFAIQNVPDYTNEIIDIIHLQKELEKAPVIRSGYQ